MSKLRILAATLASLVCALALSVGAAIAEEHTSPAPHAKATKGGNTTPSGLCFLHDVKR